MIAVSSVYVFFISLHIKSSLNLNNYAGTDHFRFFFK